MSDEPRTNRCPHCGKIVAVDRHRRMSIHGPKANRCAGTREQARDTNPELWP